MKSLNWDYDVRIDNAYIITIKDHFISESLSNRCQMSCDVVEMPFVVWDAFDGTKEGDIIVPDHSKDESIIQILKVINPFLTKAEVACCLSHISLWVHCAKIDKPIVILEHDAVMINKITGLNSLNSIVYLGGCEWVKQNWDIGYIPPLGSEGHNNRFICRAHSYSIDPIMAKNLISHVIKMGIYTSLDLMMRSDLFNITHQGVYAYDESGETTINNRDKKVMKERNDNLAI